MTNEDFINFTVDDVIRQCAKEGMGEDLKNMMNNPEAKKNLMSWMESNIEALAMRYHHKKSMRINICDVTQSVEDIMTTLAASLERGDVHNLH